LWLVIKMVAVFLFIIWIRSTLPRLRIDQALAFAWKYLLPLALLNLVITALMTVFLPDLSALIWIPVSLIIAAALIFLWTKQFKPGKVALGG
jgi:NADH-quinone oxidoreductase subunit H